MAIASIVFPRIPAYPFSSSLVLYPVTGESHPPPNICTLYLCPPLIATPSKGFPVPAIQLFFVALSHEPPVSCTV